MTYFGRSETFHFNNVSTKSNFRNYFPSKNYESIVNYRIRQILTYLILNTCLKMAILQITILFPPKLEKDFMMRSLTHLLLLLSLCASLVQPSPGIQEGVSYRIDTSKNEQRSWINLYQTNVLPPTGKKWRITINHVNSFRNLGNGMVQMLFLGKKDIYGVKNNWMLKFYWFGVMPFP